MILRSWPVNPSYCRDRLSVGQAVFLLLKTLNNMKETIMSFPVIDLARTGKNIKKIAKENGFSEDILRTR